MEICFPDASKFVGQMKSNQSTSTTRPSSGQTPSVPISVYRELAAELQATRVIVDSLNQKNQHLHQENRQLRQEMQRAVHAVLMLQPWIEPSAEGVSFTQRASQVGDPERPTWEETSAAAAVAAKLRSPSDQLSEEWLTEQPALPQSVSQTKPAKGMGGFWLTLTVLAIIVSAFGAGFLVMRPFLPTGK